MMQKGGLVGTSLFRLSAAVVCILGCTKSALSFRIVNHLHHSPSSCFSRTFFIPMRTATVVGGQLSRCFGGGRNAADRFKFIDTQLLPEVMKWHRGRREGGDGGTVKGHQTAAVRPDMPSRALSDGEQKPQLVSHLPPLPSIPHRDLWRCTLGDLQRYLCQTSQILAAFSSSFSSFAASPAFPPDGALAVISEAIASRKKAVEEDIHSLGGDRQLGDQQGKAHEQLVLALRQEPGATIVLPRLISHFYTFYFGLYAGGQSIGRFLSAALWRPPLRLFQPPASSSLPSCVTTTPSCVTTPPSCVTTTTTTTTKSEGSDGHIECVKEAIETIASEWGEKERIACIGYIEEAFRYIGQMTSVILHR
eukprot:GHVS01031391.1.p1 GENE.GHVS01031391.1~~GHVS01031391.1.p1  ORF type:complete len:363 (+),score=64.04 GHVS01031391.1:145-1233(+)